MVRNINEEVASHFLISSSTRNSDVFFSFTSFNIFPPFKKQLLPDRQELHILFFLWFPCILALQAFALKVVFTNKTDCPS